MAPLSLIKHSKKCRLGQERQASEHNLSYSRMRIEPMIFTEVAYFRNMIKTESAF
jgi:hypothetical protein